MQETTATQVLNLPLGAIRPNPAQPRQRFDEAGLHELALSLREHGVLQPVLVRPLGDGAYELVAGERRWQAAQRAGLATVPALVLDASPRRALELALVENVQRADLTPLEEAEAYRGLMDALGLTQERLAARLGISRVSVTNRLRLLALTPAARDALLDGRIAEGHARALLALAGAQQDEALRVVEAGRLTVRQAERLARRMARGAPQERAGADTAVETVAQGLRRTLGTRVRVRRHGAGLSVLIHFHSDEAAYALVEALAPDDQLDEL
jgi:ParB family transcriptional regulator, chromosome partitioning protein